jgi:acyl dehydratase
VSERRTRDLTLTEPLLRAYSRRGNFHSDADAARDLGLDALVAQGMQVAGPAFGVLLDAWGDGWLDDGALELRFVAMVREDDTVRAEVDVDGDVATINVRGVPDGVVRVVGQAWRRARA